MNSAAQMAKQLREGQAKLDTKDLLEIARGSDAYLADAALTALARSSRDWTPETLLKMSPSDRLWSLVALRRTNLKEDKWVKALWNDPDPAIRFEVLRWIADGVLTDFTEPVAKLLQSSELEFELFEAALATWNTLRGNPGAGVTDPDVLIERLRDPTTPPKIRSYALRLAPADSKKLDVLLLRQLFADGDVDLRREVIRTACAMKTDQARQFLLELAQSRETVVEQRADAISGLGRPAGEAAGDWLNSLLSLAEDSHRSIRHEALRALRSIELDEAAHKRLASVKDRYPESAAAVQAALQPQSWKAGRPELSDTAAWLARLDALPGAADPEAGRRIFHNASIGQCANCHRHSGRGNVVGPDLSLVGKQGNRANLLRSILEPNKEVAPQYFATALELEDGNTFVGILLRSSSVDVYRDATGKERVFKKSDVVARKELQTSLMPTGLIDQMSDQDLQDVLAFLTSSGAQ